MKLTRTVAPTVEPVTLDQAKIWCGIQQGVTQDDEALENLISEIRHYLEDRLSGRKLITQTWTVELDYAETSSVIRIPLVPLISVTSIKCTDTDGNQTTVASTQYQVRAGEDPRIVLAPSGAWDPMRAYDSMLITGTFGYGTTLPADLEMLMKGLILHQYKAKGFGVSETVSGQLISIPQMYERQIQSLRSSLWA